MLKAVSSLFTSLFMGILLIILSSAFHHAFADDLAEIQAKDLIRIGVKTDYPPWGMLSSAGEIVGFEPDLAHLIGAALGVQVKLKSVTSGNRFQLLEEGEVDVLIATVGDTQQRRKRVTMIEPHYYRSGVTLLSAKADKINRWEQIRGEKICLYGGAYFNKQLIQDYDIEPLILFNTRDAQLALLTKKCRAWAYDNGAIYHLLTFDSWQDYEAKAPIIYPILWSVVVSNQPSSASLAEKIANIIISWQRQATLYHYASKWALPDQAYLADRVLAWNKKDKDGKYVCQFNQNKQLPLECDQSPTSKSDITTSWWPFDQYDSKWLMTAFYQTLLFTFAVVLLTLIIAYCFTLFSLLKNPYLRKMINSMINIQRSIPPIVLLYLLYFGLFSYANNQTGVLSLFSGGAIGTALLVLSLYTAAGISSLLEDNIEHQQHTRRFNSLHKTFMDCQHGIKANLINLVKASAMASALSVPNAILVTTSLVASQGHTLFLMTLLMLFYFFEVVLFSKGLDMLFHFLPQQQA